MNLARDIGAFLMSSLVVVRSLPSQEAVQQFIGAALKKLPIVKEAEFASPDMHRLKDFKTALDRQGTHFRFPITYQRVPILDLIVHFHHEPDEALVANIGNFANLLALELHRRKTMESLETDLHDQQRTISQLNRTAQIATEGAGIGIWVVNLQTGAVDWDRQMMRLYGLSAERFQGRLDVWEEALHPEDRDRALNSFKGSFDDDVWNERFRIIRPSGEVRHIRSHGKVSLDPHSGDRVMLGVNWDVTAEALALETARAALVEAEAANRAKSEFLASMSHELRTPLNAVIGFSEMMLSEIFGALGDPRYRDYAEHIQASGSHLIRLINQVLDLSKIEAGQMELECDWLDLSDLLHGATNLVRFSSGRSADLMFIEVDPELPKLFADPGSLRQILVNLINNADKFSEAHEPIDVAARCTDGEHIIVEVADRGVGIAEEDLSRVLEPFGQVRSNAMIAAEGTGLGLSISSRLMELHGGRLEIESMLGIGTTVRLVFPTEPRTVENEGEGPLGVKRFSIAH